MTLKILQTSDVHIGAKLSYLGGKSDIHRNQIKETFEKVVQTALDQKVDLFLVAGDLFDNPFPSKLNVTFIREQFEMLSKSHIKVAVIAGNHDRLEPGSVFLSDQMKFDDPNIHIFIDASPWLIEDLDTSVYGASIVSQKSRKSPLSQISIKPDDKSKYKIGLIHGSVEVVGKEADNYPIDPKQLQSLTFSYTAIGDWHGKLEILKNKAWYAGSPELIDSDQKEAGNILVIEVGVEVKVASVKVGKREVLMSEVDLGKYKEISVLQKDLLVGAGENVIKIVELKGRKALDFDLNVEELEESVRSKFFYLKIKDRSHLELTEEDLTRYPDELLIGRYIKLLRQKSGVDKELVDEAIQYGVKMLGGQKEINR